MVVCIRKNSELRKLCNQYQDNQTLTDIIKKIIIVFDTLIKTREGFSATLMSMGGLTKVNPPIPINRISNKSVLTYADGLPNDQEINKLFNTDNLFIEPYCEFLTCLYFNKDIYFKFSSKQDSENISYFDIYILKIYRIVSNIISELDDTSFINLFLRLNLSSNSSFTNNNINKNASNKLIEFYKRLIKTKRVIKSYYFKNEEKGVDEERDIDEYNDIINNLITIINICNSEQKNININNTNKTNKEKMIFRLSISYFKSYNLLRIYFNKCNFKSKELIKDVIRNNIEIIKKKYLNNLFRFQFDYISKRNIITIDKPPGFAMNVKRPYDSNYLINSMLIKFLEIYKDKNNNIITRNLISKTEYKREGEGMIPPWHPIALPAYSIAFSLIFTASVLKSPQTFAKYIIPISYELGEVDKEFLNNFKN